MKQFFRSIKRFFRGLTGRMRAVFCLSLVLVLSLAAFGVYSLAKPEEQTKAGGNQLMFEKAERGAIESVLLHHKNGAEYSVKRYHDVTEDALGNPVEVSGFLLSDGERDYGHLTLNETALSELIVGTGSHYIVDTVLTAPDPSDPDYAQKMAQYKEKLAEFGLGEGAPYYELTTVLGAKYRVYYGVKSATGGSYYVRLEGRDTVYITAGAEIGDLLAAESPVSLLDASLFLPSNNEYAYAYPKLFRITDFTRYEREDFPDMIVKGNMRFIYLIVLVMNFFIPSGSAKAFMLIPLIVPMAQIFGISSQLCIVAFAFGDGFSNVFYPTNPALLISLGLADVSYGKWFKWSWKFQALNILLTSAILLFGLAVGY